MTYFRAKKRFQPETSFCRNKWCENSGNIPTSGNEPSVVNCGSLKTMEMDRLLYGGITGRGVTPCPIGVNPRQSILFQPDRPGFLPPQGNVRPLRRVGYSWRNN